MSADTALLLVFEAGAADAAHTVSNLGIVISSP